MKVIIAVLWRAGVLMVCHGTNVSGWQFNFVRKPVEIIEGDKSLRLNLYIIVSSYLLLILLVEPVLDWILLSFFEQRSLQHIEKMDKIKLFVSTAIYSVAGCIPASYAGWFGYRVVASAKLPPVLLSGKTHFPFTVVAIKGRQAKMFGVLIIIVSLALLFQFLLYALKVFLL